jgi:ApeA N-terminal domain 1
MDTDDDTGGNIEVQELPGEFWIAQGAGPRRRGVLRLKKRSSPWLTVDGALTSMRLVSETGSGDTLLRAQVPVNDRSLYTIHGITDNGVPVTLLEAQTHGYSGGFFQSTQAVVGAHLDGRNHRFAGARMRVQQARELLSSRNDSSWLLSTPLESGGTFHVEESQEATWLVLQGIPPRAIRGLDRQYVRPLCTLVSLSTGEACASPLGLDVQQELDSSWLHVHSGAQRSSDLAVERKSLLRTNDISPSVLRTWLDKAEKLGPLPPVITNGMQGPIVLESRVLTLTTVAEGLHRRLRPNAVRFSEELGAVIQKAAMDAAEDVHPGAGEAVKGFLSHVHEVGYGERLVELAEIAESGAPGVTGRTKRWKKAVYKARNEFAHRAGPGWFEDADYDRYATVALSLQWLLRAVLLLEAGFEADLLAERFRAHEEYQLFLEQAQTWQPLIYPVG